MYYERYMVKYKKQVRCLKIVTLLSAFFLLTAVSVGSTLAYISTKTEDVKNTFTPSKVSCDVTEQFEGIKKSSVNVKNTSDIDVFVRIKLITYRVNENGMHIGGAAEIPSFTLGQGWVLGIDGCYYYTSKVASQKSPENPLIGEPGIELKKYTDVDGGYQVIEVMAEAIQAEGGVINGNPAVTEAWGVKVNPDGTLSVD